MGKAITLKQGLQGLMALATNVDWETIDGDMFQRTVVDDPIRAGAELTAFLRNRARVIRGDPKILKLDNSNKLNFAKHIGKSGLQIWKGTVNGNGHEGKEDLDHRSLALSEVDLSNALLDTCLKDVETCIIGEEKMNRLKSLQKIIRLGGNVFDALWMDYQFNKENSSLEWLRKNRGVTYVDFFGIVLLGPGGRRYVVCLCFNAAGEWCWHYRWLKDAWHAEYASLGVSAT